MQTRVLWCVWGLSCMSAGLPDTVAGEEAAPPSRIMLAVRAEPAAPRVDGVLDDPVWQHAPRFGGFTQRLPDEGQPATDSTAVQFAYDDEALYAGIMCHDREPGKIVARLFRRDQGLTNTDWVHLSIDSNHDHQTAYSFFVTAAGGVIDAYYYNDDWEDDTWDGVWEARTALLDNGWSAEVRIPFSVLRFTPQEENVMGLNVDRYTTRKRVDAFWTFIPRREKGWVSRFGELRGLRGLTPPKSREFLPHVLARSTFEPKSLADPNGRDDFGSLGLDLRYGAASNISVNATVNPDFGQVEAAPAVLNLTVFETFYEERRPFFVEGAQVFQTPFQLFYSRRIGRVPGRFAIPAGYRVVHQPELTSILGAGKVTGKTAGKTTFGLMEAVTAAERAVLARQAPATAAQRIDRLLEPRTNYLVGRLRQDLWRGNSNVGLIATAANRTRSGSDYTGGAISISDDQLERLGIRIVQGAGSATRSLLIPSVSLQAYKSLVRDRIAPGFWNDIVGREEILFVFKLPDGRVEEFTYSEASRAQIAVLCTALNNDPVERTSDLPRYLAGNSFYHESMIAFHNIGSP